MCGYDPEAVELLRTALDQAWDALSPHHQQQISKARMARRILQCAAAGELNPGRLRFRAIASVMHEVAAA
jgi:hypothetical protein